MSLSKSTRAELRRRCPTPEETDALLDMADEREKAEQDAHEQRVQFDQLFDEAVKIREQRDRYRAALEKIATGRITGEQKHSEYASELRARIAQEVIDAALEGNDGD